MTQHCRAVRSLSLHLDLNSIWVHYDVLEDLFIGLRDRLTQVHVRFDASVVSPSILWSLSQLPHLVELHLDPYHTTYFEGKYRSPEDYLGVLRGCTNLQSLVSSGCFLEAGALPVQTDTKRALPRWMKRIFRPKGDRIPVNIFAALARRFPYTTSSSTSQSDVDPTGTPVSLKPVLLPPSPSFCSGLALRRLNVHSGSHSVHAFKRLFGLCPQLEEVIVNRVSGSFTLGCWEMLAKSCPRIRLICLNNNTMATSSLPDLATIVTDFPRLESLELIDFYFDKDPDLAALGLRLHELVKHEDGWIHPLKRLVFTGAIEHPVKVLLDALLLGSSSIEALTVGKTSSPLFRPGSTTLVASTPTYDFITPWPCLTTLAHLDIAKVFFPDKVSLHQFFGQLERSNCLRTLGLAPLHLRELYVDSTGQTKSSNIDQRTPPTLSIILPTVYTVAIDRSFNDRDTYMYHEFGALLAAVPCLKRAGFHPSIGEADLLDRLAREYPLVTLVSLVPLQGSIW